MALGTTYNNAQRKDINPTTYSQYKFSNPESTVDKTALSFSYWKGLLKISIAPKKNTNDDTVAYDYENQISIYLSFNKAYILRDEIQAFLTDTAKFHSRGVSTNKGCIYICDGSEFNIKNPCLVIKLTDDTTVLSSIAYEFKTDYHFAIRNITADNKFEIEKAAYDNSEILQFINLLNQFIDAATFATAASVHDALFYETNRMQNNINSIAEKLGVDVGRKSPNSYSSKSSFFNSSSSMNAVGGSSSGKATAQYSSYEDLELEG